MKILPEVTVPSAIPMTRNHTPKESKAAKGYQKYRQCLRWEFGFTCAFCLVHETDWTCIRVTERTGLFSVEHVLPQSTNKGKASKYGNCVLACRSCNTARRDKSVHRNGAKLLDPTTVPWGSHFLAEDDCLKPLTGDKDAKYTHEAYRIDDSLKVDCRAERRNRICQCVDVLQRFPDVIAYLTSRAREKASPAEVSEVLQHIEKLEKHMENAKHDLEKLAAIPRDHARECACGTSEHHSLPDWLDAQTWAPPF